MGTAVCALLLALAACLPAAGAHPWLDQLGSSSSSSSSGGGGNGASGSSGQVSGLQCGDLGQHVFNRPIPSAATDGVSPYLLFFLAMADYAYNQDFGLGRLSPRRSPAPCLEAWGARNLVQLSATDEAGGSIYAFVAHSDNNVFVSFRGLASRKDARIIDANVNPFTVIVAPQDLRLTEQEKASADNVAFLLNANASAAAEAGGVPSRFVVLEGYAKAYISIANKLVAAIKSTGLTAGDFKLYITGHSDGSCYAQLASLHLAGVFPGRHGGTLLFGPQRCGNDIFEQYYNTVYGLGNTTLRFSYGRDPASEELYTMSEGLRMVGRGLAACPYDGRAIEQLVVLPPGEDRMNVCAELAPPSWVGRAGAVLARFGAAALTSPDPEQQNSGMALAALRSSEYIANHLPSVVFDAAMRQLSVEADPARKLTPCQAAALRLPQCIVSSKCDTAVRPPGARQCRTCGSDATCQQYYGSAHAKCDHRSTFLSGWLCYDHVPPTILGLLTLPNGA